MNKFKGIILIFILIVFLSTAVFGDGVYKKIEVYFDSIKIEVINKRLSLNVDTFIYNDKLYIPLRYLVEEMGGQVEWDNENRKVTIKTYEDFPQSNPLEGETFVYGIITKIDYENYKLEIQQLFDDNSIEVTPLLEVRDDVVIILKRNDKMMNVEFKDLKCGDDVGLVLDKNKKVRGIIITF